MYRTTVILIISLFLITFAVSSVSAHEKLTPDELFKEKCSICHSLKKTLKQVNKDRLYWEETVTRMSGRFAIPPTAEEQETIVEYLLGVTAK
jgi:hypothetical protein